MASKLKIWNPVCSRWEWICVHETEEECEGGGIENVVEDTTPQLGGDLDCQEHDIDNVGNIIHDEATASDFVIENADQDKDIVFKGNDGGDSVEILKLDVSEGQLSGMLKAVAGVLTPAVAETDYSTGKTVVGINDQTGTTYTLVAGDAGKLVRCNNDSAITLTVPKNSSVAFVVGTVITVEQKGAGQVTVAPVDGDVTINSYDGLNTAGQYAAVSLIKVDTDVWACYGGIA